MAAKGFLGQVEGKMVAVLVYKEGKLKGQIATAVVPNENQLKKYLSP